jgi:hypothetical protein
MPIPFARYLTVLALHLPLLLTPAAAAESPDKREPELTAEEIAEREGRKTCKLAICAAFHTRRADGGDIACTVVKSWRKEQLTKVMAKAKASWPWGRVVCRTDVRLARHMLIKAMTEPRYEATLDKHAVACEVERDKDKAEIRFEFTPKVAFENGKAVKATLNWGKVEAPAVLKGAMWTATATDNTFNVLQGTVVEDINDFIDNKCAEVKDEWQAK